MDARKDKIKQTLELLNKERERKIAAFIHFSTTLSTIDTESELTTEFENKLQTYHQWLTDYFHSILATKARLKSNEEKLLRGLEKLRKYYFKNGMEKNYQELKQILIKYSEILPKPWPDYFQLIYNVNYEAIKFRFFHYLTDYRHIVTQELKEFEATIKADKSTEQYQQQLERLKKLFAVTYNLLELDWQSSDENCLTLKKLEALVELSSETKEIKTPTLKNMSSQTVIALDQSTKELKISESEKLCHAFHEIQDTPLFKEKIIKAIFIMEAANEEFPTHAVKSPVSAAEELFVIYFANYASARGNKEEKFIEFALQINKAEQATDPCVEYETAHDLLYLCLALEAQAIHQKARVTGGDGSLLLNLSTDLLFNLGYLNLLSQETIPNSEKSTYIFSLLTGAMFACRHQITAYPEHAFKLRVRLARYYYIYSIILQTFNHNLDALNYIARMKECLLLLKSDLTSRSDSDEIIMNKQLKLCSLPENIISYMDCFFSPDILSNFSQSQLDNMILNIENNLRKIFNFHFRSLTLPKKTTVTKDILETEKKSTSNIKFNLFSKDAETDKIQTDESKQKRKQAEEEKRRQKKAIELQRKIAQDKLKKELKKAKAAERKAAIEEKKQQAETVKRETEKKALAESERKQEIDKKAEADAAQLFLTIKQKELAHQSVEEIAYGIAIRLDQSFSPKKLPSSSSSSSSRFIESKEQKQDIDQHLLSIKIELLISELNNVIPFLSTDKAPMMHTLIRNCRKIPSSIVFDNINYVQHALSAMETLPHVKSLVVGNIVRDTLLEGKPFYEVIRGGTASQMDVDLTTNATLDELRDAFPAKEGYSIYSTYLTGLFNVVKKNKKSTMERQHIEKMQIKISPFLGKNVDAASLQTDFLSRDCLHGAIAANQRGQVYLLMGSIIALATRTIRLIDPTLLELNDKNRTNPELLEEGARRFLRALLMKTKYEAPLQTFQFSENFRKQLPNGLEFLKEAMKFPSIHLALNRFINEKILNRGPKKAIAIFDLLIEEKIIPILFPGLQKLSAAFIHRVLIKESSLEHVYAGLLVLECREEFQQESLEDGNRMTLVYHLIKTRPLYKTCFDAFNNHESMLEILINEKLLEYGIVESVSFGTELHYSPQLFYHTHSAQDLGRAADVKLPPPVSW